MEHLVGAGGWAYFDVPGEDALAAYAKAFPFVEVNASFYAWPDPRTVIAWCRRVPAAFRFAVRAHKELSHRYRLRPTPAARASFARTAQIAAKLRAVAIVVETPATVEPKPNDVSDLLSTVDLPCPVALEARAYAGRSLPPRLAATLEANDVADVVDLSRQSPRTNASLAYCRMFGLGTGNRWEFTADELAVIKERGDATGARRVAFTFHGVRMYKDAGRFLTFVRVGKVPAAGRQTGLESLGELLEADARFPAAKADLIADHGFRVVSLGRGREVHAVELLRQLPGRRFQSAADALVALAQLPGLGGVPEPSRWGVGGGAPSRLEGPGNGTTEE